VCVGDVADDRPSDPRAAAYRDSPLEDVRPTRCRQTGAVVLDEEARLGGSHPADAGVAVFDGVAKEVLQRLSKPFAVGLQHDVLADVLDDRVGGGGGPPRRGDDALGRDWFGIDLVVGDEREHAADDVLDPVEGLVDTVEFVGVCEPLGPWSRST
jgi:hypothetical protein